MIKIIKKQGEGKTLDLIRHTVEAKGVMLVSTEEERIKVMIMAKDSGFGKVEVITYRDYLLNYIEKPVFIDNIDKFLETVDASIKGFTCSEE